MKFFHSAEEFQLAFSINFTTTVEKCSTARISAVRAQTTHDLLAQELIQ